MSTITIPSDPSRLQMSGSWLSGDALRLAPNHSNSVLNLMAVDVLLASMSKSRCYRMSETRRILFVVAASNCLPFIFSI